MNAHLTFTVAIRWTLGISMKIIEQYSRMGLELDSKEDNPPTLSAEFPYDHCSVSLSHGGLMVGLLMGFE